jgi:hypothetical protein
MAKEKLRSPSILQLGHYTHWFCPRTCPNYGSSSAHVGSVFISVDGSCTNRERHNVQASCAVVFHPENTKYNYASGVPGLIQTSTRAELTASLMDCRIASRIKDKNPALTTCKRCKITTAEPETYLNHVVIMTDHIRLVHALKNSGEVVTN